jgi:aminoglycoside phosphotransferase (APT) family kinase protein
VSERVPERFRADVLRRIGHGGEATVYELTGNRALRVYHGQPHGAREMAAFYDTMTLANVPFSLPRILEQGEDDGICYSVDQLIPGRPLHELMPLLRGDERALALAAYAAAAFEIATLPAVRDEYGEFLRDEDSISAGTWHEYLLARMHRSLQAAPWLRGDVPELDAIAQVLVQRIRSSTPAHRALVHGDYFPGNVLMSDDLTVTGVIDFGPLTVIGDPWLDLASAVMFLEVVRPGYLPADTAFVQEHVVARAGSGVLDAVTTYRGWYAIRFSPYRDDDPNLYDWCVTSLRNLAGELVA